MKNSKPTPYIPPELEIALFDCKDIVATSTGDGSDGFVPDDNVDNNW